MSESNEKELLKTYEQYLAYFLDSDMNGINSLVKFPITYIADGECKLLDAFPVTPKEMMENKSGILQLILKHMYMVQILRKGMLLAVVQG